MPRSCALHTMVMDADGDGKAGAETQNSSNGRGKGTLHKIRQSYAALLRASRYRAF